MYKIIDNIFIMFVSCVLMLAVGVGVVLPLWNLQKYHENRGKHILLETNEIGCSRYSYNKTTYWKCPDKLINSVDVVGYKGYTKQEPVVK